MALLIGRPAPLHGGVRSSNHDRGCDRRDAWVGLSPDLKTITSEPTVGKATPSTRAKWRSSLSACHGSARKGLDTADIVREAIYQHLPLCIRSARLALQSLIAPCCPRTTPRIEMRL